MTDRKAIPITPVLSVLRRPIRVQDIDDDGMPRFYEEDMKDDKGVVLHRKGEPVLVEATPFHLIRAALSSIPQACHKDDDGLRIPQLFNRIDSANGNIELKEKHYLWLHRLLERRVPLSAAAIEANKNKSDGVEDMKPPTYAHTLWGDNDAVFINALRPIEEQKDLYTENEED